MWPPSISWKRMSKLTMVVLPAPVGPTMATGWPGAGPPDVADVALDHAVVNDVRAEDGQEQVPGRLDHQQGNDETTHPAYGRRKVRSSPASAGHPGVGVRSMV
jgi:hypothetical protein